MAFPSSVNRFAPKKSSGFSDPQGQTKATPDHQRPSGGGQSIPSSGGSSGAARAREAEARRIREAAEKARIEREAIELKTAQEKARVEKLKRDLIAAGARKDVITTRDKKTGQIKRVEESYNVGGKKLKTYTDYTTGLQYVREYQGGRLTSFNRGRVQSNAEAQQIRNDLINAGVSPIMQNGRVVGFESMITGKKYNYSDGGIAMFNRDKQTISESSKPSISKGEEAIQWFNPKIEKLRAKVEQQEKQIEKLMSEGKKKEAIKVMQEKNKNKKTLFGYQSGQRIAGALVGLSYIPSIAKEIYKNPSYVVPLTTAMLDGFKADVLDTVELARISPTEAVARIGTDYITFKAVTGGLRATGRIVKTTGKGLSKLTYVPIKVVPGKVFTIRTLSASASRAIKTSVKDVSKAVKANFALRKKVATIRLGTDAYSRSAQLLELLTDKLAEARAREFLQTYIKKGGKLGLGKEEEFIRAVRNTYRGRLTQTPVYSTLKRLASQNKFDVINLYKKSRILSAKQYLMKGMKDIDKLSSVVKTKKILSDIKRGIYKPIKKASNLRKKIKGKQVEEIGKFKSRVEYVNSLKKAKSFRKLKGDRWKTINVNDGDYSSAINFIRNYVDRFAEIRARQVLKNFYAKGGKLGLGKEEEFIRAMKNYYKVQLNKLPEFKRLVENARLKDVYQIRFRKVGRIESATKQLIKLKNRINNLAVNKKISSGLSKGGRVIRNIRRKTSPRRIKSNIRKTIARRRSVALYKKTNRYLMEKNRPIRKVTLDYLQKSATRSRVNSLINNLFDEARRRNKIDLPAERISQLKNVLKHRIRKAINTNDVAEIAKFKEALRNIVNQMNSPSKQPNIVVIQRLGKSKVFRTIKDFTPETPKGTYVEVKSGQQVLLQRVETVGQKIKPQRVLVKGVLKKRITFAPIVKYGIYSISREAFMSRPKLKQMSGMSSVKQISGLVSKQESKQDLKILQSISPAVSSAITSAIASAQKSRTRGKQILRQVQKEKKKPIRFKIDKQKSRSQMSGVVPTYQIIVKQRGKGVTKQPRELTKEDARDFLAYQLDNSLSRTGKLVATGRRKKVERIGTRFRGYYEQNSKKLRQYKIRKGKAKPIIGFIEKRRYFQDTRGERLQAARLRASSGKRVVRRSQVRRRITPAQRRVLLKRLELARRVRARNLARRRKIL